MLKQGKKIRAAQRVSVCLRNSFSNRICPNKAGLVRGVTRHGLQFTRHRLRFLMEVKVSIEKL